MNTQKFKILSELAPCGIYCGACPSFRKSCFGCSSEKEQKRKSKWNCYLRTCCYTAKKKNYCIECDEFPCKELRKKLLNSHVGDPRYRYRHEVIENFNKLKELGTKQFVEYQQAKWSCSECEGKINWYYYNCSECGEKY